jgi:hypothetical protein
MQMSPWPLNKNAGSQFDFVQSGGGARHLRNSARRIFDQVSCFPNYKVAIWLSVGGTHSVMNWERPVSYADFDERNQILLAIEDYHQNTPITFKYYDPQTDWDYVHITGEDSGCWSYVGRQRGVSNTVENVDKKTPALRTAPLGFRIPPKNTSPLRFISCYKPSSPGPWQ